jgi:hypothetical protein
VEKIIEIKNYENETEYVAGYEVITNEQRIKLYIDNDQSCCESFGYFWCNDDPQEFIGAELYTVTLTDTALNQRYLEDRDMDPKSEYFSGGVMFVNLETSKGTLQFVAYNEHDGYYGHEATVECTQLAHSETL